LTSLTPHSRRKRPTVGIIFVIISCLSLQFGAAFAVHLFPLFGPWLVTVLRLLLAALSGLPGAGGRIGQVHKPRTWRYPQKHPAGS